MDKRLLKISILSFLMLIALSVSTGVVEAPTGDYIPPVITFDARFLTVEEANSMTQEDLIEYFEYWDNN